MLSEVLRRVEHRAWPISSPVTERTVLQSARAESASFPSRSYSLRERGDLHVALGAELINIMLSNIHLD